MMSKVTVDQFAKLMVDDKVGKILNATQEKDGLTPKEISKATKIANNKLYYTLNKMVEADLLMIVRQKKVKNLTENYYSSSHLSQQGQSNSFKEDNVINFSDDWIREHGEQTLQLVMLQHHELIEALKSQLKKESDDSIAMSSHSEIDLSAEGEKKLISDLFEVLGHAEENDPNPDAKEKRRVRVQLEKW